jgi:hypothetical protein
MWKGFLSGTILATLTVSGGYAAPAVIDTGERVCGINLRDGTRVRTTDTRVLITNSKTGVTTLKCKFDIPDYKMGLEVEKGEECIIITDDVYLTTDSHQTISPSGQATLTCKMKLPYYPYACSIEPSC